MQYERPTFDLLRSSSPRPQSELREAIALALASLASKDGKPGVARDVCRLVESAVLASDAGPMGLDFLETLDARLRETMGEHDLLDGRYA